MVGPGRERTIVEEHVAGHSEGHVAAARGDAVAPRRDSDDQLVHWAMA